MVTIIYHSVSNYYSYIQYLIYILKKKTLHRVKYTYRCGSTAKKVEISIFSKQVCFWLRCVKPLTTHYKMAPEVITCIISF